MLESQAAEQACKQLNTVFDFVRWLVSQFNQSDVYFGHGTDNPWDEAYSLVYQAIGLPVDPKDKIDQCNLTDTEKQTIVAWAEQRINQQVPLAYLTNTAWFCGKAYYVDERVLVPRSPIGELIQNQFDGLIPQAPQRILDLCTGSGCIAIACAYAFPQAEVDAVDISSDALEVCEMNIEHHGMWQQVIPIQSDVFSGVAEQKYDVIVSNPPYVDAEDMADLPSEFHHEPELGLAAGVDGLSIVNTILSEAAEHLSENGVLIVEVGNSLVHMEQAFPGVEFNWIEFKHGGIGVFMFTRSQLLQYRDAFVQE
ncbi:methylase [Catenovulum agarivorans DS-2]|uniref:Ribosomal protein uL3 glutamine methyltransferase n=1 Tax=Catenovulum agarivorans DS-2 TaxID=1328313 RepID=W7QPS0_9ALTE|nr:50S ribosomal protein L3 N(5)-glutamine methyltransferase [Catenovulum agarivorans]EWH09888.1 methylase [Catenovulum agarivorans DS-2]